MIAVALLAVLGIVAVVGHIYRKGINSGHIDSLAVLPLDMRSTEWVSPISKAFRFKE